MPHLPESSPRRRQSGVTLLELMIVISIAAILATIAIPSFQYLTAATGAKNAATELYLSLLRTRSEAVKRDQAVTITASGGDWAKGWTITDASNNVIYNQGKLKGATVTTNPSTSAITYLGTGRVQGNAPGIQVVAAADSSVKRCVQTGLTGQPRILKQACPT